MDADIVPLNITSCGLGHCTAMGPGPSELPSILPRRLIAVELPTQQWLHELANTQWKTLLNVATILYFCWVAALWFLKHRQVYSSTRCSSGGTC